MAERNGLLCVCSESTRVPCVGISVSTPDPLEMQLMSAPKQTDIVPYLTFMRN